MTESRQSRGKTKISFVVNGEPRSVHAYPMERLLDVLRQQLQLTGTKEGCGEGECGSCSVLMDGALVNSCLIPVLQAQGSNVVTIEGLACGETLHILQKTFLECGGAPCGICTPGMVLAACVGRNPGGPLGQSLPLHRL
jgi:aerobic carbon-monoxide dehydrogenase small subunit